MNEVYAQWAEDALNTSMAEIFTAQHFGDNRDRQVIDLLRTIAALYPAKGCEI